MFTGGSQLFSGGLTVCIQGFTAHGFSFSASDFVGLFNEYL